MLLNIDVEGVPVTFRRSWLSGQTTVTVNGEEKTLQSPLDPGTHVSVNLRRQWQLTVNGHDVVIQKDRPVLLSAFRPHTYRVLVDGKVVQERTGF